MPEDVAAARRDGSPTCRCSTCASPAPGARAARGVGHRTSSGPAPAVPLPDDRLLHACVLTYLSDVGTGLEKVTLEEPWWGPSLDHAVWFHHPARLDDWVLVDLVPGAAAGARGFYTGTVLRPRRAGCSRPSPRSTSCARASSGDVPLSPSYSVRNAPPSQRICAPFT